MDGKTEEGEDVADVFKGVEGGWALELDEYDEALQVLTQAVEKAGYTEQVRFVLNLDGNKLLVRPDPPSGEEGGDGGKAAEEDDEEEKRYDLGWKASDGSKVRGWVLSNARAGTRTRTSPLTHTWGWRAAGAGQIMESEELSKLLAELIEKYPIVSMEDPFANNDRETYKEFTTTLSEDLQVVGDKLVVRWRACVPFVVTPSALLWVRGCGLCAPPSRVTRHFAPSGVASQAHQGVRGSKSCQRHHAAPHPHWNCHRGHRRVPASAEAQLGGRGALPRCSLLCYAESPALGLYCMQPQACAHRSRAGMPCRSRACRPRQTILSSPTLPLLCGRARCAPAPP